jgi:hypothetical protein
MPPTVNGPVALKKIAGLERQSAERYVSPYQLSLVYCYLGEREMAIAQLQKASEIKEAWLNWAGGRPCLRYSSRRSQI